LRDISVPSINPYFRAMPQKLLIDFYEREDVVQIAKDLLGKHLYTRIDGVVTAARITETEAYCGATDKACHTHLNRRTKRTEIMYGAGGRAYVYLCYGIHHLFNVVTNVKGAADAVLIRAAEPLTGKEHMQVRRGLLTFDKKLTAGPGSMSKALGITTALYGEKLWGSSLWIEDAALLPEQQIQATTRIGIDYAGEDAFLPWRFYDKNTQFVSRR
jgi:DNA-3-methyladenine glycosylase